MSNPEAVEGAGLVDLGGVSVRGLRMIVGMRMDEPGDGKGQGRRRVKMKGGGRHGSDGRSLHDDG